MPTKIVTPEETQALLEQGYVYVDVRSEQEFEAGHVPGALNVPLLTLGPSGMTPNPDFVEVMESAFAKDEKLVVGCKAGGRSARAAQLLESVGFEDLADMSAGWDGGGEPGWSRRGLPIEMGKPEGQAYVDVKKRTPSGS